MALTDIQCKKATVPDGKMQKKFSDSAGLYLLVNRSGKYWRFDYRIYGKRKTLSLGVYPTVSLKDARLARDKARINIKDGIDPGAEKKKKAKSEVDSFESVGREWFAKHSKKLAPTYKGKLEGRLERYVYPTIGHYPIAVLQTQPNVIYEQALEVIEKSALIETAHRVRTIIGQIFRYGAARGVCQFDPTPTLKGVLQARQPKSMATITHPPEIGELLRAMDAYEGTPVVRVAMNIAPLVFVRPGELRRMEWAEIDFDKNQWRIPAEKMKMPTAHIVPLSKQVIELLQQIKPLTGSGKWVFPSLTGQSRPMSENAVNQGLRRIGYGGDQICGHGFRSMASTLLHEHGYLTDAIERQMAHMERDKVKGAYNYAQHLPERVKMMQEWADYLDSLRDSECN